MPPLKDLTGQRIGRLTIVKRAPNQDKRGAAYWECKCDCGKTKIIRGSHLIRGDVRSCGCMVKEIPHENKYTKEQLNELLSLPLEEKNPSFNSQNNRLVFHLGGHGIC